MLGSGKSEEIIVEMALAAVVETPNLGELAEKQMPFIIEYLGESPDRWKGFMFALTMFNGAWQQGAEIFFSCGDPLVQNGDPFEVAGAYSAAAMLHISVKAGTHPVGNAAASEVGKWIDAHE